MSEVLNLHQSLTDYVSILIILYIDKLDVTAAYGSISDLNAGIFNAIYLHQTFTN